VSYRSLTHQFETASPFLDQPGYTLWDANLTYSFGSKKQYSFGLHAKNITDVRYKIGGYQYIKTDLAGVPLDLANKPITNGTGYIGTLGKEGIATAFYGNPRQVFGTFSLKF
jgi:iron complex outermembrane receptor protein